MEASAKATKELDDRLSEDIASRATASDARVADLEEKLAEEATSRAADFERTAQDLDDKTKALEAMLDDEHKSREAAYYENVQERGHTSRASIVLQSLSV